MRRDTIFHQIFLRYPKLLFELLPDPPVDAAGYVFESIEVKETAFRTDGVWMPPQPTGTVYFAEVQFQPDEVFYERMNAEIGVFVYRNRSRCNNWQGIVLFPSRTIQQKKLSMVQYLLDSGKIIPIFLDELRTSTPLTPAQNLMVLTTLEGDEAVALARETLA